MLQEKAMEGPCEEATRENLAFIAEQVSHHPPSKWAWSCPSCMVGAELEIDGSVFLLYNACGVCCISAVELFTGI